MKGVEILKSRYKLILGYTGVILLGVSIAMLTPLLTIPFFSYKKLEIFAFIATAFFTAVIGFNLKRFVAKETNVTMSIQEGGIVVLLSWITTLILSSLPFVISGQLNFVQAMFEVVSGYTTTGLSVVDVRETTHMVLLWRSVMQFLGGVGLVVIMLSAIIGPHGVGLYNAEARSDKLVPNIRKTTKMIMIIYVSYIIGGIILYVLAGMPIFDAINHSIAAVSTGGFSTKYESIGYYNSTTIELITIILMVLGTINFAAHAILWKGKVKEFLKIGEFKTMLFMFSLSIPLILFFTTKDMFESLSKSIRVAVFEIISAVSTTGFSTVGYTDWNDFGIFILVLMMIIGGGTGSTAGGIKQYRVYILFKSLWWNIKSYVFPRNVVKEYSVNRADGKFYISDKHIIEVCSVTTIYMIMFIISVVILMAHGYGMRESIFEIASCLSTVGLSIGITSPNAPNLVLIIETIMMFLGRLEFIVVFYSILRIIRDFKFIKSQNLEN